MAETRENDQGIPRFIVDAMKKGLEMEYEDAANEAVARFEKSIMSRKDAVIATTILNITKQMDFQRVGERMVIEIRQLKGDEEV